MKRNRWKKIILMIIIIAPLAIFIFGSIVMLLWNNVAVPVLHVSSVTFWQALGLLVLSKILFSSFGKGGRNYPGWRERMAYKWNRMTPEEKEKFKAKWQERWCKSGSKPWDEGEMKNPENYSAS